MDLIAAHRRRGVDLTGLLARWETLFEEASTPT